LLPGQDWTRVRDLVSNAVELALFTRALASGCDDGSSSASGGTPMAYAHRAGPARRDPDAEGESAGDTCATSFTWSRAKMRVAAWTLVGAAAPAAAGIHVPVLRWVCLAWLAGVAWLMHGLSRRAADESVVLLVDRRGILDRRLLPTPIRWQEIEAICPVDPGRARVVDINLRWPRATLAGARWQVRIGARCQTGYGVPAVTISMLLLEGSVRDLLAAVARHRADLLPRADRGAPPSALP